MAGNSNNYVSEAHWYSMDLPPKFQLTVLISVSIVFFICLLDLTGWIFNIPLFKSLEPDWISMKVVTSICSIFSGITIILIQSGSSGRLKIWLAKVLTAIIITVSLLTITDYLYVMTAGREASMAEVPVLNLFLIPENRMAILTAIILLFIGCILFLFSEKNVRADNIAHILIFPAALASYFVPVTYILDVYSPILLNIPVALNTGIALCALCTAVIMMRTNTWLMKVFSNKGTGGIMARRLLPALIVLPVIIGWLRIYGEHSGFFKSEVGVAFVALTYTACFVLLIWLNARSVNKIDDKRLIYEQALIKSREELEIKVRERTSELMSLNEALNVALTERKKADSDLKNLNTRLEQRVIERTGELLESEQRYRFLVDSLPHTSIQLFDHDHRFLIVGGNEITNIGFDKNAIEGRTLSEAYSPEVVKFFTPLYNKALKGEATTFEHAYGQYYYYQQVSPVYDKNGEIYAGLVISTNITERKKAEKELFGAKNYLENLINYANAPIIVWDISNKIQLFNHAFERLTGYSSSEVLGKNLDLLFPEATLKESNKKIRQALSRNWETIEISILTKDKKIRTALWNSANIYDIDNKTIISTIAQGNDITERIMAEEQMQVSKEKLNLALENGNIGIWEWDISTNAFEMDERMGKMIGLEAGSFEKTYAVFERRIDEEDVPHFRKAIKGSLENDIPLDCVYRIKIKDGVRNYISTKALVGKDNNNKPVKMTGVCYDITEMRKGAEQTLFRLNEELLRSNKELEQFAYIASHDLQEPLRMVSSFTQLLSRRYKDKLDNDAQEFIQYAVDGAARMQGLINDLLEYSRVETKGKKFSVASMHCILGKTISNLNLVIREKNAIITNDDLPELNVDEGQMIQLLQNLIENSLKFCDSTPIIHISSKEEKDHFLFSVKDNGIGIESPYFERIFMIFQQLQPKEQYGGTGIGLAICKRIVERHGGKIWVESTPGKGATFYFTISKKQIN